MNNQIEKKSMKKLVLASVIATVAMSAQVHAEKKPFPKYSDDERLELICTVDGIPNTQIAFDIRPTEWEREYAEDGWTRENKLGVTVEDQSYVNTSYSFSRKGDFTMIFSHTKYVNRITGAYEIRSFQGGAYDFLQATLNYDSPRWKVSTGTCKPGKHITEAQF